MLTFTGSKESQSHCFKFIGADNQTQTVSLISNNSSILGGSTSLLADNSGSGLDTCSFYSGPSDATIQAFGESSESIGSVANFGGEYCGTVAYAGSSESIGSVAYSGSSTTSSSSFSGGCSYSC